MNDDRADILKAAEAHVLAAFASTSRHGGVTWAQTIAIAEETWSDEPYLDVVWQDRDLTWMDLLEMPWDPYPLDGGLFYTDAKSFPYYLAAMLVHGLRRPPCWQLAWKLESERKRIRHDLKDAQQQAVIHVVESMIQWCREDGHRFDVRRWDRARKALEA